LTLGGKALGSPITAGSRGTGIEALRKLKASAKTSSIPVLVLSAMQHSGSTGAGNLIAGL
jgi:response regulator RpfG family c-di-GMP phosphodiesterase